MPDRGSESELNVLPWRSLGSELEQSMIRTNSTRIIVLSIAAWLAVVSALRADDVSVAINSFPLKDACDLVTKVGMKEGRKQHFSVTCDPSIEKVTVSANGAFKIADLVNDFAKQVNAEVETGYDAGTDTYHLKGSKVENPPSPTN